MTNVLEHAEHVVAKSGDGGGWIPVTAQRILLPVERSRTLRRTVAAAVERAAESDGPVTIRAVYLPRFGGGYRSRPAEYEAGRELLDLVEVWIEEDLEGTDATLDVETAVLSDAQYPHKPPDVADALLAEIEAHDIDLVLFDPLYDPGVETNLLAPIERLLRRGSDATVEEAAVPTSVRRPRLPHGADLRRYAVIFGLTLAFYVGLAGTATAYTLVTGVLTAAAVTLTLGGIALWQPPGLRYTPWRVIRGVIYVPYLLVMIVQANVSVARVILDPRVPIEPAIVRLRPAVFGPFPLTTLANSITLTPGTLSMRVLDQELLVHTLIPEAREDLVGGRLERAVRFVFYGRRAMRVASPAERGDADVVAEGDPKP